MKRKTIIIICCIILCALVGTGAYMHLNATNKEGIEKAELGRGGYASKYNGKKCSVRNGREYCKCYGCASSNRQPQLCSRCGHRCDKHTR